MARPKKATEEKTIVDGIEIKGKYAYTPFGKAKIIKQEGDTFFCEYDDKSQKSFNKKEISIAK
jgi:hypothetical protein